MVNKRRIDPFTKTIKKGYIYRRCSFIEKKHLHNTSGEVMPIDHKVLATSPSCAQKDIQCGDQRICRLPFDDTNTSHLSDARAVGQSTEQNLRAPSLQFYTNPCSRTAS